VQSDAPGFANQATGLLADALAEGVKAGGTPGFSRAGAGVEVVGTALSVHNITRDLAETAYSANATEYSENFNQQIKTSVTAIATAAAGSAIATTAFTGLATVATVVTAPVLAASVAAAATVAVVGTLTAGVLTSVVYDRFASAGVKEMARSNYNSLIGGFSSLRQSLGF